jgi:hypothetical protein
VEEKPRPIEAVIIDIKMSFGSMIVFLVKLAFAAIPAALIIALGYIGIAGFIAALVTSQK